MALAREVPRMEFENTVIALLDGAAPEGWTNGHHPSVDVDSIPVPTPTAP